MKETENRTFPFPSLKMPRMAFLEVPINQKEDREELLEGLCYLRELPQTFSSIPRNFPYDEDSKVSIAENVLRNDSMGGIILDYFKTHYANPIAPSSPDLSMLLGGDETKLTGADNAGPEIVTVRFHHRTVREYLTAEWFAELLRRETSRRSIEDLFFRNRYGLDVVVPTLRPILPWLAILDEKIKDRGNYSPHVRQFPLPVRYSCEGRNPVSKPSL
ncbi:MAG: hypothetical protein OXI88_22150 [Gammaproteobacteria bacterium]|nr:hypothetical protein [Gammaproteobacteria bacterium]